MLIYENLVQHGLCCKFVQRSRDCMTVHEAVRYVVPAVYPVFAMSWLHWLQS